MNISMNNTCLSYMGRINNSDPAAPVFYYPGSQAELRFTGRAVTIRLKNHNVWGNVSLGYVIDGRMGRIPLDSADNDKEVTLRVVSCLEEGEHTLIIYKRYGANHFYSINGIDIEDGEILPCTHEPSLKIEAYGDSVCAGELCEAVDFTGRADPENAASIYDNSWYSFVMQTARILGASINNISQGGIAVLDKTGYYHMPDTIGMETVYNKLCHIPEAGELTEWDFSRYIPDIVILALGQNDHHNAVTDTNDVDISDPAYRRKWKDAYMDIIRALSRKYGSSAKYVLTTTLLRHERSWDDAIGEMCDELNAEGIAAFHNVFTRNGDATDGHPRISEHDEMADELVRFIRTHVLSTVN